MAFFLDKANYVEIGIWRRAWTYKFLPRILTTSRLVLVLIGTSYLPQFQKRAVTNLKNY